MTTTETGKMFTNEELVKIYFRLLVTPPFKDVMKRFTDEINQLAEERVRREVSYWV